MKNSYNYFYCIRIRKVFNPLFLKFIPVTLYIINSISKKKIRTTETIPGDRALIELFKKNQSFIDFQEKKELNLSEVDFCLLIKVRQTASHTLFKTKFLELTQVFEEYQEEELLLFLKELKKKFNFDSMSIFLTINIKF